MIHRFRARPSGRAAYRRASLLLAPLLAGPALAQAQPAPATDNGEILVTAQRRVERLQDVPISVSVVSGAAIRQNGVRNLGDLTARIPGVNLAQVPGSDLLNIRGVGSGINLGFEQSVATFVDGIYRGRARASRLAFFDVDRVEVLKGPQTTFFGNNAIAGALNITTRKPGDHFEYDASTLYAPTDGEYSIGGGVSTPVTDTLSIRVAGQASGMDGYIRNVRLDDHGPDLDDKIGRIAARWRPDPAVTIDARVDVGRMRDKGIYDIQAIDCPPDPAIFTAKGACARALAANGGKIDDKLDWHADSGPSSFRLNYEEAMLRGSVNLGDATLSAVSGYYHHDYTYFADVVPTGASGSAVGSAVGTANALPTRSTERFRQFSQEVRLESTGQHWFDYMIGGYVSDSTLTATSASGYYFTAFGAFAPAYFNATDPIAVAFGTHEHERVWSLFGSSTLHFTHRLRLNLGLRYTDVSKHDARTAVLGVSDNDLDYITPGPAAGQAILLPITGSDAGDYTNPRRNDHKLLPSANLQYDLARDVMAYASYSKGFKAGGYSIGASKASFAPETVDAFEVGLKTSFLDRRITLNGDLFLSNYNNLQESLVVLQSSGTPLTTIANVAKSRAKGVETSASFRATPHLTFTADVAYLSSRYVSYPSAPCTAAGSLVAGCTQDLSGHVRAYAPRWSGNVGLSYAHPLNDRLEARLDTSVFFTSRYYEDSSGDPLSLQSGYAKWDARIGVGPADRRWEIAVIGKNLTDEATAQVRRPLPSSVGSYEALVDRPRSVALQFSIKG